MGRRLHRKWAVGVFFGLLGLLTVLLINAARFRSRQLDPAAIRPYPLEAEGAIERFRGALRFETISYANRARIEADSFRRLHQFLENAFPIVHDGQQIQTFRGVELGDENNLSLLYRWQGREPHLPAVLLMAHLDVVPVERDSSERWTHTPFSGELADGFIWGRGALDVKDAALAILEAMEFQLRQGFQPRRTIYLSLGHDEEVGGWQGNRQIAQWMLQNGVRLEFILDEGGCILADVPGVDQPVALIGIAEKGHLTVRLIAEAPGGHAAMPPRTTAVGILAQAIRRLEDNPWPRRLDGGVNQMLDFLGPEMPFLQRVAVANRWLFSSFIKRSFGASPSTDATLRTTAAVTAVRGGIKDNVLPTQAEATVNIRILPGDHADDVLAALEAAVNDRRVRLLPEPTRREPSPFASVESESFHLLHTTIREVCPDVLVAPFVLTGGTDSSHYTEFMCDIYRFTPARLETGDIPRIHGVDERISRHNYLQMISFYIRLIEKT